MSASIFFKEGVDSYLADLDAASGVIGGFTKSGLPGEAAPDMRTALAPAGFDARVACMQQVHGSHVKIVSEPGIYAVSDGLFTAARNLAVVVRTADCLPLIFYSERLKMTGVVHMGWRSASAGILRKTGIDLSSFLCIAGVGMRACCYEVGEEFLDKQLLADFLSRKEGKLYLDPVAFARAQLVGEGMRENNFIDLGICSRCSDKGFHSHRRTGTAHRTLSFALMRDAGN